MPPFTRIVSAAGWARIVALALIALAAAVTWIDLHKAPRAVSQSVRTIRPADPLQAELLRCQALGQAGATDPGCLAAWAESRRRFLGGSRA